MILYPLDRRILFRILPKDNARDRNSADPLLDRSIHIVMQRKRPGQHVDQFRSRTAKEQANGPSHAAQTWCQAHREAVERVYHKQHIEFLQDRKAVWGKRVDRLPALQANALEMCNFQMPDGTHRNLCFPQEK
jgi:hypothetical protein